LYVPDITFIGSIEKNVMIKNMLHYMTSKSADYFFTGDIQYWCLQQQKENKIILLNGSFIGIKDKVNKQITINDLMDTVPITIADECIGIYIPADNMAKRMQYNYFLSLEIEDILTLSIALSTFFSKAIHDSL
jgi:hypothetical protein